MTGLNPPGHGARHNGMRMGDAVPTLASAFAGQGFATAAFVSAFPLDRRFGLSRGFETYDDGLPRATDGRPVNERRGGLTIDAALGWLVRHRDDRFFLWVHLFEPHAPYGNPTTATGTPLERYDAEIAEADRQVARLLDGLGSARTSTLVIAAGDHGEAFGEHGEIGHSVFVYDTTLRIPLIMSGPGVPPPSARVVEDVVGLVDIAPSVATLFGLPALGQDGLDLRAPIDASRFAGRALYAESFAPLIDFGWSPLRAVREGRWKYIAAPRAELYNVNEDPVEAHNQLPSKPDDAARLAARVAALAPASLSGAAIDPEAAVRLGSLGYVSAPNRAGSGERPRPDPKDRVEIAARMAEVTSGEIAGERLVPALEALLRDDPGNPHAELRLGVALADRDDCSRAEPHLRAAIRSGLPSADPFISLAYCHRRRGASEAARRALFDAERVEPGNPVVAANLGLIAFDSGQMGEAIARLEFAVTREPDLHEARFVLARAYARTGRRAEAQQHAATLLSRLPSSAPQRSEVERLVAALR